MECVISPLVGGEKRSAQRTKSQLLGFSSFERPAGQRGGAKERGVCKIKVPRPTKWGEVARRSRDGEGSALRRPLSVRFADTSPRLWRGEEPRP
ncbi:hypothetical protein EN809_013255 [Mesorhizobium sp. M2E.F.Ca.ET.166.01.1.1]|nr:hypothetical protein EN862_025230 [Mesorhizobium sp. M2E.F.Ca.ET.219.01.1.1]TGT73790.1 hypothetical protein EN809_013255 [Mesorhizobium sp. M2E.F.Ca.ET.166.01.1.1]TGW00305.1 hypothetical protein EN797_019435 [Mesorhizobium sp. M2E.F.Ca.ET.154.01.1.1]